MATMAKVPGSCGELAQGIINGRDMLITCPISWHSEVVIEFVPARPHDVEENYKSYEAVRQLLRNHRQERDFSLIIRSTLPRSKGMASSSADIAAACAAAAQALEFPVDLAEINKIALAIEPTDGVFFPGIVAFDHIRGDRLELLGEPPDIKLAIFDFGGEVDTTAFNRRTDLTALRRKRQADFAESYALIKEGLATGNPVLIGKGATISALSNQIILPKPCLEKIMLISSGYGALGVNIAHSGTVAGVLFDAGRFHEIKPCTAAILAGCPDLDYLGTVNLVPGGILK